MKLSSKTNRETPPPPLQSARLPDQVRELARHPHYSPSTEKVYVCQAVFLSTGLGCGIRTTWGHVTRKRYIFNSASRSIYAG